MVMRPPRSTRTDTLFPDTTRVRSTDAVFRLLRNGSVLQPADPNLVVCWGGHSINRDAYQYTKDVGYELGLRGLDICTSCGPGQMKGPMKGATIPPPKPPQRPPPYIAIPSPGITSADSPHPHVNQTGQAAGGARV